MDNNEDVNYKKIKTGIDGLDELLYGGLRLPDPNGEQGVCIAIYGNRGISKTDLALQIMYGVAKDKENSDRVKRYDMTIPSDNLKSKYRGLLIGRAINQIKQNYQSISSHVKQECNLCNYFDTSNVLTELKDGVVKINTSKKNWDEMCDTGKIICQYHERNEIKCDLCKLLRHEVINYNDRTQALHWTVGDLSDESNLFAKGKRDYEKKIKGIFEIDDDYDDLFYTETPIQRFQRIFRAVKNIDEKELIDAIVIGGFTAIGKDIDGLPLGELIKTLKEKAKVSVLVFDERGEDLHLNVDILIKMRTMENEQLNYLFHELCIEKSDLQRHVYGWHRYKKQRDLSIKVIPNLNLIMSKRFASVYAPIRMERDSWRFRQTLLQKYQDSLPSLKGRDKASVFAQTLGGLLTINEEDVNHLTINTEINGTIECISNAAIAKKEVAIVLFGRDEMDLYKRVTDQIDSKIDESEQDLNKRRESLCEVLSRIHCWNVRPCDILPEEIVGYLKDYIYRWWNGQHDTNHLYLYIDDLSLLGAYPMVENEGLFVPALFSICNEVRYDRDFNQPLKHNKITLHIVCSDPHCPQYKYVEQLGKRSKVIE